MKQLYEDQWLLVGQKAAGEPIQPDKSGERDALTALQEQTGGSVYLVHRLDRPVGGIVVFAKSPWVQTELTKQFLDGRAKKTYLAVVEGQAMQEGAWTDYLKKNGRTNVSSLVPKGQAGAKQARLSFVTQATVEVEGRWLSLLKIHLQTGRHHQIRAQMAHAGWPLLGDQKYNPKADANKKDFPALCAFRLTFRHPRTGKRVSYQTEPKGQWFRECKFFLNGFLNSEEKLPESID